MSELSQSEFSSQGNSASFSQHSSKKLIVQKSIKESQAIEIQNKEPHLDNNDTLPDLPKRRHSLDSTGNSRLFMPIKQSPNLIDAGDGQSQHKTIPSIASLMQEFDPSKEYKKEYHRIYLANMVLMDRINTMSTDNETLRKKISQSKKERNSQLQSSKDQGDDNSQDSETENNTQSKKKKKRKKKEEILRNHKCDVQGCGKSYG